jgi:hypothetical protein
MPSAFVIALSLHMLAATFWAGSTFVLARTGGLGMEKLRAPQLGAALVAVVSGGYMGHAMHAGAFTRMQLVLLAGAACALLAGAFQLAAAWRARRAPTPGAGVSSQRIAAALLAIAAVCMVVARYA